MTKESKMRTEVFTPEEIINTINRSSLKTVLVEGKDDLSIYRKIEDDIDDTEINILPCGGRSVVLKIYEQKAELKSKTLFVCDSDLWHFTGFPDYIDNDVLTTTGYSIENDMFIDGEEMINGLLTSSEVTRLNVLVKEVSRWYSFEVEKHISDQAYDCRFSDVTLLNESILAKFSTNLASAFLTSRGYKPAEKDLTEKIIDNFKTLLRGKFIFQIIEKLFQERGKDKTKFSKNQLFDIVYSFIKTQKGKEYILTKRKKEIEQFFT